MKFLSYERGRHDGIDHVIVLYFISSVALWVDSLHDTWGTRLLNVRALHKWVLRELLPMLILTLRGPEMEVGFRWWTSSQEWPVPGITQVAVYSQRAAQLPYLQRLYSMSRDALSLVQCQQEDILVLRQVNHHLVSDNSLLDSQLLLPVRIRVIEIARTLSNWFDKSGFLGIKRTLVKRRAQIDNAFQTLKWKERSTPPLLGRNKSRRLVAPWDESEQGIKGQGRLCWENRRHQSRKRQRKKSKVRLPLQGNGFPCWTCALDRGAGDVYDTNRRRSIKCRSIKCRSIKCKSIKCRSIKHKSISFRPQQLGRGHKRGCHSSGSSVAAVR